ncbi:hypothetical protein NP777_20225 [Streptomyces sp. RCU064]|uniref:Uncharacterized protein n=1 Tax=Streptomyces rugosispiralis TaxID=2967341 RepID=A0ABT1V1C7_9ACTN|nr:hypothetical protein [Streptomyces rugosispiralis]
MSTRPRLLPWPNAAGRPCYLVTDENSDSPLSQLADEMEAVQLHTASELLGRAGMLLADPTAGEVEMRFLVKRLCEGLRDTLRVAESRGGRLPALSDGEPHDRLDGRSAHEGGSPNE